MNNIGDKLDKNLSGHSLLISDLHLCASRPHITIAFLYFLENTASKASALYILGDLFEYWAGDDILEDSFYQPIISTLKRVADQGVKLYIMHGNRDFLISDDFSKATGMVLLKDPSKINLHGKTTLLSHGDSLCTDDLEYQKFKQQVRDKKWQENFLSQTLLVRKNQIEAIRTRSTHEKSQKPMHIMDANQSAIDALLKAHHYPELLIHGHTHRPNQHHIKLDGHTITRWVLGDWYEQGSYLQCDQFGCSAKKIITT